ncbi:hypothetical protein CSW98_11525 [Vibrio sp. HA2012]|uniref:hypothetical protein n=1 Tax=Vibrio sp. HA2012 TaxID=1971595 RepID=UPI000C2B586D|nr:hypothetical protein [Vibrio sp. HA2012]PJC86191.1 hypothetical protein CSW98_11525 [Vibrio sp. HA2012]
MKKGLIFSILILICGVGATNSLRADILEGEGYGDTVEQARVAAVAALANNIYVNVESKSSSYQDSKGTDDFIFQANTTTNIPVLGVKYLCNKTSQSHLCSALLDTEKVLPLYETEIKNKVKNIDDKYLSLSLIDQNAQIDILYSILTELDQYEKLSFVTRFISEKNTSSIKPSVTIQQINSQIIELEDSVTSLYVAAKVISRKFKQNGIYIEPVSLANSREITPFASALADELRTQIKSINNRDVASYILEGGYIENKSGIRVNYNLSDKKGNTIQSVVISLLPESYSNYRTTPLAPDFDKLLHNGYAVSSEFKTSIATNKGFRNLVFKSGEEVELLMKMNRPGYFYIVGHTKNSEIEQSYLIELNDALGDRHFIGFINADDINKWVSLGEFVVEEPFGLESIQLMASTNDFVGFLPSYSYMSNSGYYVISDKIEQGVKMTRGLKKVKQVESDNSESVLLFTTENN